MDSGWLKALELPAKITGGIFVACLITWYFNSAGLLSLTQIGPWFPSAIVVIAIFSGALFGASLVNEILTFCRARRAKKAEDAAAKAEGDERAAAREDAITKALTHLNTLSEEEVYIVAKALEEGSPSIKFWYHSSGAAQLAFKGLLVKLEGQYHRDYWPYIFNDFAWAEMQKRKEEFLKRAAKLDFEKKRRR